MVSKDLKRSRNVKKEVIHHEVKKKNWRDEDMFSGKKRIRCVP